MPWHPQSPVTLWLVTVTPPIQALLKARQRWNLRINSMGFNIPHRVPKTFLWDQNPSHQKNCSLPLESLTSLILKHPQDQIPEMETLACGRNGWEPEGFGRTQGRHWEYTGRDRACGRWDLSDKPQNRDPRTEELIWNTESLCGYTSDLWKLTDCWADFTCKRVFL